MTHDYDPSPPLGTDAVIGSPTDYDNPVEPFEKEPSIVDQLKQEYEELTNNRTTHIAIPGYERIGLTALYHLPENGKMIDRIARQVAKDYKDTYSRNLYTAIDMMLEFCDGLYVQPSNASEPVTFDPDLSGVPCKFDARLCEALGWTDVKGARQTVSKLFGGNQLAILDHAEKLNRWMRNTKTDLTAEYWETGE